MAIQRSYTYALHSYKKHLCFLYECTNLQFFVNKNVCMCVYVRVMDPTFKKFFKFSVEFFKK